MPSHRLVNVVVKAPVYSIVGSYADASRFVSHVGIISEQASLESGRPTHVAMCEMNPPLHLGDMNLSGSFPATPSHSVNVICWLDLSADQRDGISDWIAALRPRFAARMPPKGMNEPVGSYISRTHYSIHPAYRKSRIDKVTGREIHEYFNCVGFVLACYSEGAGIELLVNPEKEPVPLVGLKTIGRIFGEGHAALVRRYRTELELKTMGPWPILFGGYIFHAIHSDENSLPHYPRFVEIKY